MLNVKHSDPPVATAERPVVLGGDGCALELVCNADGETRHRRHHHRHCHRHRHRHHHHHFLFEIVPLSPFYSLSLSSRRLTSK